MSLIRTVGHISIHLRTDPCVVVCAPAPRSRNLKVTPSLKFLRFLEVVPCIRLFTKLGNVPRNFQVNAIGRCNVLAIPDFDA